MSSLLKIGIFIDVAATVFYLGILIYASQSDPALLARMHAGNSNTLYNTVMMIGGFIMILGAAAPFLNTIKNSSKHDEPKVMEQQIEYLQQSLDTDKSLTEATKRIMKRKIEYYKTTMAEP